MKYYKIIINGYITKIGINCGGEEISAEEYNEIMSIIRNKPEASEGYAYQLRADLTWELVELPPEPYVPTAEDKAEAYDILMGVSE